MTPSLRTLMIVVLLVGGLLGWQARRASVQRRAVAQLRAVGAGVTFRHQLSAAGSTMAPPPAPAWLRGIVGDEPFQEPSRVVLVGAGPQGSEPTDATVAALASLDRLALLFINETPLNDGQFARLGGLTRLTGLSVLDDKLTARCLPTLRGFPQLETLILSFDRDEPASTVLPAVAHLTRLRTLSLLRVKFVTAADMAPLRGMADLEMLHLDESPADETCLESIADLRKLRTVDLRSTRVSDSGMDRLANLAALEGLRVDGAAMTDAGLGSFTARRPALNELLLIDQQWSNGRRFDPSQAGSLTDRGLALVGRLTLLDQASLAGRFTDAGLIELARCPKLTSLELNGLEATTTGLQALLANHQFVRLGLSGPAVSDDWAPLLAGQTRLSFLALAGPNVTDATLARLALGPLETLCLAGSRITDSGLRTIAATAGRIRHLDVRGTAVTADGLAAFRRAVPRCEVVAGPIIPRRSGGGRRG